jgi:hypothetical protein
LTAPERACLQVAELFFMHIERIGDNYEPVYQGSSLIV